MKREAHSVKTPLKHGSRGGDLLSFCRVVPLSSLVPKIKVNITFIVFLVIFGPYWPIECSLKGFVYLILILAVWAIIKVNQQLSLRFRT